MLTEAHYFFALLSSVWIKTVVITCSPEELGFCCSTSEEQPVGLATSNWLKMSPGDGGIIHLTIAIRVHSSEVHFILFHSFLEMFICLFHDPALHLFRTYLFIVIYIHPMDEQQTRFRSGDWGGGEGGCGIFLDSKLITLLNNNKHRLLRKRVYL